MKRAKFPFTSGKNHFVFLTLFGALIFCFTQTTSAQSGRKTAKPAPTEPTVSAEAETKPEAKKNSANISAIKITGELQYESGTHYSTYLSSVLDECAEYLKGRPTRPLDVSKVGKMKLNDAKELAKKETGTHVLWMGFFIRSYMSGLRVVEYVDYIDYALMSPETGKVVTYGRIEYGKANMGNAGTVLQIPTTRTTASELQQLRQGAREIATILKRGGWLD